MGHSFRPHQLFLIGCTACIIVLLVQPTTAGLIEKSTVTCRNETTQILVNETTLERCAYLCWSNCNCNVTRERPITHTTTICEELTVVEDDGRTGESRLNQHMRKLTDPEVAAIAVISSLVFSILISLTVFLIQRRTRPSGSIQKPRDPEIASQEKSFSDGVTPGGRLLTVQPANRVENIYEDVQTANHQQPEAVRLLSGTGEVLYSKPIPGLKSSPLVNSVPIKQPPHSLDLSGEAAASESQVLLTESIDPSSLYVTADTTPRVDGDQTSGAIDDLDSLSHHEIMYENINHPDTKTSDL